MECDFDYNLDLGYGSVLVKNAVMDKVISFIEGVDIIADDLQTDALKRLKAIKQIASGHEFSYKKTFKPEETHYQCPPDFSIQPTQKEAQKDAQEVINGFLDFLKEITDGGDRQ